MNTKPTKHELKRLWKQRNPLADGLRFRSGSGKHGKSAAQTRGNERVRTLKEALKNDD